MRSFLDNIRHLARANDGKPQSAEARARRDRKQFLAAAENPLMVLRRTGFVDESWYLTVYEDMVPAAALADEHYLVHGARRGCDPNPLFRSRWYEGHYPSVRESGLNPAIHYLLVGSPNGLKPNPLFDPAWYRKTYPDVVAAGLEPLVHYLKFGAKELRNPGPEILTQWLPKILDDTGTDYANPLASYLDLVETLRCGAAREILS